MIVYKITNKINGKIYIGQTILQINKRWKDHCKPSRFKKSALSSAIQKYGKDNFIIEKIDKTDTLDKLNFLEKKYISNLNTLAPNGYNLQKGGDNKKLSEKYKIDRLKKIVDTTTGIVYKNIHEVCKKFNRKKETIQKNIRRDTFVCSRRNFEYLEKWNGLVYDNSKDRNKNIRKAKCYKIVDITTGYIYNSIPEASEKLKIPVSSINYNVNGSSKTCHGKVFKKMDVWDGNVIEKKLKIEKPLLRKKIIEIFTKNIYNSINEAAHYIDCKPQSITDNLSKRTKIVKNKYRFEYV